MDDSAETFEEELARRNEGARAKVGAFLKSHDHRAKPVLDEEPLSAYIRLAEAMMAAADLDSEDGPNVYTLAFHGRIFARQLTARSAEVAELRLRMKDAENTIDGGCRCCRSTYSGKSIKREEREIELQADLDRAIKDRNKSESALGRILEISQNALGYGPERLSPDKTFR
jgi:hypothetical protein